MTCDQVDSPSCDGMASAPFSRLTTECNRELLFPTLRQNRAKGPPVVGRRLPPCRTGYFQSRLTALARSSAIGILNQALFQRRLVNLGTGGIQRCIATSMPIASVERGAAILHPA